MFANDRNLHKFAIPCWPCKYLSGIFMWEEGMNTKPQIYYNNKHASTPQASKRKKASQMKTICRPTLEYREVENTHTK